MGLPGLRPGILTKLSKIFTIRTLLIVVFLETTTLIPLALHVAFEKPALTLRMPTAVSHAAGPPAAGSAVVKTTPAAAAVTPAMRLRIPKIGVSAPIDPLGTTAKGEMAAPSAPQEIGWYRLGPRPGDIGSAVIAGHYGLWADGETSIFDHLNKLVAGDKLYIDYKEGKTVAYIVRKSQTYDPNADASNIFKSSDGKSHINLVTCAGKWDEKSRSYSKRLVVFADKEQGL